MKDNDYCFCGAELNKDGCCDFCKGFEKGVNNNNGSMIEENKDYAMKDLIECAFNELQSVSKNLDVETHDVLANLLRKALVGAYRSGINDTERDVKGLVENNLMP